MNRKGFTLVELLAVILILSLLALITSTTITKIVQSSKTELYNSQMELIKVAAEAWGEENVDRLPDDGECKYLTLEDLKTYGVLDKDIINPQINKEFSNKMKIKITSTLTNYGNLNFKYEVDPIDISSCTPAYMCTLVNDADNSNSITPGDKYLCKVKDDIEEGFEDGYYFFVLGVNDNESVNLIMERNMYYDETNDVGKVATEQNKGYVAWMSREDYNDDENYGKDGNHDKGPVTAMTYLHNVTKDWDNIPNMIMNYADENITYKGYVKGENGYGSIVTTGTTTIITSKIGEETGRIENLKARLPRYDEVHDTGKCDAISQNNNHSYESSPLWLVNYLDYTSADEDLKYYSTINDKVEMSYIRGYWILSSRADFTYSAWSVHGFGTVFGHYLNRVNSHGVRPVITVPQYYLSN